MSNTHTPSRKPPPLTAFLNDPATDDAEICRLRQWAGVIRIMSKLPVRLGAPKLERRGGPWREAVFFLIAFLAMFGAAALGLDLLSRL